MQSLLAALADPARWRIVTSLAERPRSVGVIAQLTGLRQPQATKHLQTLNRAGLVTSRRSGQRRIYALEPAPLREIARALDAFAETVEANRGPRESFDRYFTAVTAERLAADRELWADERRFTFRRTFHAPREVVWRHVTDPGLMAAWWTPNDLRMSELVFEDRPGARVVQEYRDADDADGTDGVVGRAEGVVETVRTRDYLAFRLSPLMPDGSLAFTGNYEFALGDDGSATVLDVRLHISDSVVASADFIAGIELGWNQSLDKLAALVAASTPAAQSEGHHQQHHQRRSTT